MYVKRLAGATTNQKMVHESVNEVNRNESMKDIILKMRKKNSNVLALFTLSGSGIHLLSNLVER